MSKQSVRTSKQKCVRVFEVEYIYLLKKYSIDFRQIGYVAKHKSADTRGDANTHDG